MTINVTMTDLRSNNFKGHLIVQASERITEIRQGNLKIQLPSLDLSILISSPVSSPKMSLDFFSEWSNRLLFGVCLQLRTAHHGNSWGRCIHTSIKRIKGCSNVRVLIGGSEMAERPIAVSRAFKNDRSISVYL